MFFIRARQGHKDEPAFVALTCMFIMAAGFPVSLYALKPPPRRRKKGRRKEAGLLKDE